jgi:hypothetical protein
VEVFEVRAWSPERQEEFIVKMSLDEIARTPTLLNMADVGIIFLNEYRKAIGLTPMNPALVKGSIEDLRKTGLL